MNDIHCVRRCDWVSSKSGALIRPERQCHSDYLLAILLEKVTKIVVQVRPPHLEPHSSLRVL
jgi:hypothetical protein